MDSVVLDYMHRGAALATYNVYDFIKDTYEEVVRRNTAPENQIPYLSSHPHTKTCVRRIRHKGHNCLPDFMGQYLPRSNDPDVHELYCATVLMLFKPWWRFSDLHEGQTWSNALTEFRQTAAPHILRMITNIQLRYSCEDAAEAEYQREVDRRMPDQQDGSGDILMEDVTEDVEAEGQGEQSITEQMIQEASQGYV